MLWREGGIERNMVAMAARLATDVRLEDLCGEGAEGGLRERREQVRDAEQADEGLARPWAVVGEGGERGGARGGGRGGWGERGGKQRLCCGGSLNGEKKTVHP